MAGIRKKTVRHQWNGGTRTYWRPPLPGTVPGIGADAGVDGAGPFDAGDEVWAGGGEGICGCGIDRGRRGGCGGSSRSPPCAAATLGSMKRPKIIFPAVVCSTLVTTMSMV